VNYETKIRSLLKALSWRTLATITTGVLVFVFTGELALAITVGSLEVIAKMFLYFLHERAWQKIKFGKKEIPSFVIWFTGLPSSGKKEIADRIYKSIQDKDLRVERIDSRGVRPLFPETGFAPDDVDQHVRRSGHLCAMLEKSGVIAVASFVSPYKSSRKFARNQSNHFVEVYLNSTPENCARRDNKDRYARARNGEYSYFPGVDVQYEESSAPEIVLHVDDISIDEAVATVEAYLAQNFITVNQ
jgi:adenylylsulfate kinase